MDRFDGLVQVEKVFDIKSDTKSSQVHKTLPTFYQNDFFVKKELKSGNKVKNKLKNIKNKLKEIKHKRHKSVSIWTRNDNPNSPTKLISSRIEFLGLRTPNKQT